MTKKRLPTKKVAITSKGKTVREVEVPVSKNRNIQDGVQPTTNRLVNKPPVGHATIGANYGVTLNMGDFQSARLDIFIQRNVPDDDDSILEGYEEMSELLQEEIERQSIILAGEEN